MGYKSQKIEYEMFKLDTNSSLLILKVPITSFRFTGLTK